jgi:hypothetical protein
MAIILVCNAGHLAVLHGRGIDLNQVEYCGEVAFLSALKQPSLRAPAHARRDGTTAAHCSPTSCAAMRSGNVTVTMLPWNGATSANQSKSSHMSFAMGDLNQRGHQDRRTAQSRSDLGSALTR